MIIFNLTDDERIFQQRLYQLFDLGVALCCQHGGTGNRYPLCVGIAKIYICDGGIRRKVDSVSFPLHRSDAFASSSARPGGSAEGASGSTGEVPDGSLPDALGRPVDHGGGGRRLPPERTGDEAEVGGHAEAAGIPEDGQLKPCQSLDCHF